MPLHSLTAPAMSRHMRRPRHGLILALVPLLAASPASAHGERIVSHIFFTLLGIGTAIGLLLAAFVPRRSLPKFAALAAALCGAAGLLFSFYLGDFPRALIFTVPLVLPSLLVLVFALLFRSRSPERPTALPPPTDSSQRNPTGA